jgi:hypothetical protein
VGYFRERIASPQPVCEQILNEPNCRRYDMKESFASSSLECLECVEDFYLQNGACVPVEKNIPNCEVYNQEDFNLCAKCLTGFYLSDDER